jgi:hypothetical protein
MNINKGSWSTKDDVIRLSMPISKVDKERRIVSGFATLDNLDRQGDIVPAEASVKAFETFRGNLREMHQPIAVGKIVSFKEDKYFDEDTNKFYNGIYVSAYVSKGAQDTWEKVLDGTLTGFSIGGNIDKSDDVYNSELDKACRVIKEYTLSELSLVDNPANQFANVLSIQKGQLSGYLSKATIENVFWCRNDDIITMSYNANIACPQCDKTMNNIGFVENNDSDKATVVKGIISSIKKQFIMKNIDKGSFAKYNDGIGKVLNVITDGGAKLSTDEIAVMAKVNDPVVIMRVYIKKNGIMIPTNRRIIKNVSSLEKVNAINKSEVKEVSKMDSNIIVVDEIQKGEFYPESDDDSQVNPGSTSMPVADATKSIEIEIEDENEGGMDQEEDDKEEEMMGRDMAGAPAVKDASSDAAAGGGGSSVNTRKADGDYAEQPDQAAPGVVVKAEEEVSSTTKMIAEISNSLSSALSTLAETVKALDAKIDGVNKAVAGISSEVNSVKDSFGKRVDAVEKDTAFRKSADLGEILQEQPVQIMEKSMWGGRFLTNADL